MIQAHDRYWSLWQHPSWMVIGLLPLSLTLVPVAGWGQTMEASPSDETRDVTVIETTIGLDQIVGDEPMDPAPVSGSGPQVDVRFVPNEKPAAVSSERPAGLAATTSDQALSGNGTLELDDKVFLRLNATLRRAIEQNQELITERQQLNEELTGFVGQKRIDATRINSLMVERDAYKKQAERILTIKEKLEDNISDYKRMYSEKQQNLQDKIAALKKQLAEQMPSEEDETALAQTGAEGEEQESKTTRRRSMRILKLAETLSDQQKRLKDEEGEIHYNMGNVFFHQGMYERALDEYQMAVKIMPEDANAHFNLAYVSSEYVLDQKTALYHYRQYLRLNPQAADADLVQEKILEAELDLQARTGSPLEQDLLDYRRDMYTYQSLGP